jgi:acetyl esterase
MFTHLGPDDSAEQAWQLIEDALREAFQVKTGEPVAVSSADGLV